MSGAEIVRDDSFAPRNLRELVRFAEYISASGLVPEHLRGKPRDIVVIALRGHELGLSLLQSLSSIHVVEGRPSLAAELWVALVRRSAKCEYFKLVESTDAIAVYEAKRVGGTPVRLSWSIEQARVAGLANKSNWRAHPAAMLRARCAAALARVEFSDVALGLIEHDEAEEITGRPVPIVPTVTVVTEPSPKASNDGPEAAAPEPAPTPLDGVRGDIAELGGTLTVDQAAAVFVDRRPQLGLEDAAEAFTVLLDTIAPKVSIAALKRAVAAAEAQLVRVAETKRLREHLATISNPDAVASAFAKHRASFALDDDAAIRVAFARLIELGRSEMVAMNSLRAALNAATARAA